MNGVIHDPIADQPADDRRISAAIIGVPFRWPETIACGDRVPEPEYLVALGAGEGCPKGICAAVA